MDIEHVRHLVRFVAFEWVVVRTQVDSQEQVEQMRLHYWILKHILLAQIAQVNLRVWVFRFIYEEGEHSEWLVILGLLKEGDDGVGELWLIIEIILWEQGWE